VVAEDDRDFRSELASALRASGYAVAETRDGAELLDVLHSTPTGFFDLVIADQRMPGLLGLECLARAGARAPFLMLTGEGDPLFQETATRFGAAAVLRKPIDLASLLAAVATVLSSAAERSGGAPAELRVSAARPSEAPLGQDLVPG
jgi:DNA-binding response OmpR family regulator